MYLHLGEDVIVKKSQIVGIFDLDTSSVAAPTREYLKMAQKEGTLHSVNEQLPKSFVVLAKEDGTQSIYFSQISASVLKKRATQRKSTEHFYSTQQ